MRNGCRLLPLLAASAVLFSVAATLRGDAPNVRFRHLGLDEGLPAAGVQAILQDRDGFVWLGTQGGLGRFDGYELRNFQHHPGDDASLSRDFVWSLLEDRDGVLWVGTDGGGVSRFDESSERFVHFRHDPADAASLSSDRVRVLLQGRDGALWIGTEESGLNRFDPASGTATRYRHDPGRDTSLAGDLVRDLFEDRLGMIWVATDGGGLSVLDLRSGLFTRFRHDPQDANSLSSDRVRCVFEDRAGNIWAGTYDGGLNRLDPGARTVERFLPDPEVASSLSSLTVRVVFEDSSGNLWVGTDGGLDQWDPATGSFTHHRHEPTDPYSLDNDTVSSIFEDRGGVLWVGTYAGLNTWNSATGRFRHHRRRSAEPTELSNNFVFAFAEDADGAVWVGTFGGLDRFDRTTCSFRSYLGRPGDTASLDDERVMALLLDREGALWIGTREGGLGRFDPASGSLDQFRHDPGDPRSLAWDGVTSLLEDREGILWVGTIRGGLHRFDRARGDFTRYRHAADDPSSLSSDRVTALHEDRAGALWVATEDAGLNRLDRDTGSFSRFGHDPGDERSLSGAEIMSLAGDADDALWIGTRASGLNRWGAVERNANRLVVTRYGRDRGLRSNTVYAIEEGAPGEIWFSSDRGLARLDVKGDAITYYDGSHGLQSLDFNFAAAMRARDGTLFFGGVKGFNVFRPTEIRSNPHRPPVVLTRFLKFNRPVDFGRPLHEVDEIGLKHSDSVVAFEFAALDYTAPDKNRYRYQLEGFDGDWIESGSLRHVTYTNLRPGAYVFRARASNNDGVWSDKELAVRVVVGKPPWLSWWAYLLYVLAGAGLMATVAGSIERKRRHARALEGVNVSLRAEIRERQAKERALEAEKRKARLYLDVAEVIMVALDDEGRVTLINQKGCRLLGFDEDEIVGSDWVERFVPEGSRSEVRAQLDEIGSFQYYEYPLVTREGDRRTIAWYSTRFVPDPDSAPIILSSGSDITQMRELERQVRMAQKMEALGTLAGGIAHDFNNILTAVYGYSTLTLESLPRHSQEAAHLEQVVKASERARDLVGRILTFSRRDERPKEAVALGPVIAEAAELLRSTLPATIQLRTEIDSDCPPVIADTGQIHQVVMNLGTNAAHALEAGGEMEIRFECVNRSDRVRGTSVDGESRAVLLTITDNGRGIDAATMEKIFDPFFTTKRPGSGTGLGLSVVHGIVESHGGTIDVSSRPGHGTVVAVELPCTERRPETKTRQDGEGTGTERILFVDDEPAIVRLAKISLEGAGYEVDAHTSGREALHSFRSQPDRYGLLVTDQLMPDMTGIELIEEVRRLSPDFPVVVASGTRREEKTQSAGHPFLQKPFSPAEISRVVRRTLDKSANGSRPRAGSRS